MENNVWNHFTNINEFSENPLIITKGEGAYVYNDKQEKLVDAISGIWNVNLGYGCKEITDYMIEKIEHLETTPLFGRTHYEGLNYAEKLISKAPEFSRVFYTTGGSDAVETAIKLARLYHYLSGTPKKIKIGHFQNSYHGVSLGALSLMGIDSNKKGMGPVPAETFTLPFPNVKFKAEKLYKMVIDSIEEQDIDKVAAIIIEPILGAGGIIPLPRHFLHKMRKYLSENNILLIFDEVVTGFGRTGSLFAYQDINCVPDIITLAKGITSGYASLGATLVTDKVERPFRNSEVTFRHGYTNGGNILGCAAANATLKILERDNVLENVRKMGKYLEEKLLKLNEQYNELIENVRGRGLMFGIQLKNRTKTDYEIKTFYKYLKEYGVLSRPGLEDVIVLMPPLICDKAFIDDLTNRLSKVIQIYKSELQLNA